MERITLVAERISQLAELWAQWFPIVVGGFLDYVNQVRQGKKTKDLTSLALHLGLACFFGWVTGSAAAGFGYSEELVAASGGLGGFFGIRVSDAIMKRVSR